MFTTSADQINGIIVIVVFFFYMLRVKLTNVFILLRIHNKKLERWKKGHRPEHFLAAIHVTVVISATWILQVCHTALLPIFFNSWWDHLIICECWVIVQLMISRDEWNVNDKYHTCIKRLEEGPLLSFPTTGNSCDCIHALAYILKICSYRVCADDYRTLQYLAAIR